jgi:mannose-6-phosphate isomerase-like protein (cupin superfamily)
MEKVSIEDVPVQNSPLGVHSVRKPVSSLLGTTDFAMNYFELEPGESFSGGLHTHHDQEEVFYVEEGHARFDVGLDGESVTVEEGELIRFEPGEFQAGYNEGEGTLVGWALGAPGSQHDWDEIESVVDCRDCGEETPHGLELTDEGRFRMTCNDCGTSFTV